MNDINTDTILDRITETYRSLSPQLRQAAKYILDNPNEVGVSSMRQLAAEAGVKPNTLVRMAKALGQDSYEAFRQPFREELRRGADNYPDRARWLQHIAQSGSHGQIFSQMAGTSISNLEMLFSTIDAADVKAAADLIIGARTAYIMGLGGCYPLMHGFCYVGRMALDHLVLVPQPASPAIDDIARIGKGDVLFVSTYQPYRRESVEATRLARELGANIISLTDSRTSPIALEADILFVVPTTTPQFFPSTLAMAALLETLLMFMVAESDDFAVGKIERFHRRREETSVYWPAGDS